MTRSAENHLQTLPAETPVSAGRLAAAAAFTVSGFAAAILSNLLIPQIAEGLKEVSYPFGPLTVDRNGFYRIVLGAVILLYLLSAVRAWFDEYRRARYVRSAAFRFAMGILLAVLDLVGTKLRLTPQPFFPGPAQVLESFLMEGGYIGENILYSLRLFSAGFCSACCWAWGQGS